MANSTAKSSPGGADGPQKTISRLQEKERWMKWLLITAVIVILLLLLFLGYATDWTRGLRRDPEVSNTSLDTATEEADADSASKASERSTTSTGGGSTQTSSNTTNKTTVNRNTTKNNSVTSVDKSLLEDLASLYQNVSVGDNINDVFGLASELGVAVSCENKALVEVCVFGEGDSVVTTKSLLGTGIVTSLTSSL